MTTAPTQHGTLCSSTLWALGLPFINFPHIAHTCAGKLYLCRTDRGLQANQQVTTGTSSWSNNQIRKAAHFSCLQASFRESQNSGSVKQIDINVTREVQGKLASCDTALTRRQCTKTAHKDRVYKTADTGPDPPLTRESEPALLPEIFRGGTKAGPDRAAEWSLVQTSQ